MQSHIYKTFSLLLLLLIASQPLQAEEASKKLSTEERLARLERLLESQGLVDILVQLENLQTEVQRLQGKNEVQAHTLEEIKKRQRDLYIDIDRRLLQIERNVAVTRSPAIRPEATADMAQKGSDQATAPGGTSNRSGKSGSGAKVMASTQVSKPSEQQAYQKAFDLLRELRYDKATEAFRDFLRDYPEGRYSHIAQYWLGEASYAQRHFEVAIQDYRKLIDNHPGSPKIAEAMLKIGYSQYELKKFQEAQTSLENLVSTYPGTTEAGQAQNLLKKIKLKRSQ